MQQLESQKFPRSKPGKGDQPLETNVSKTDQQATTAKPEGTKQAPNGTELLPVSKALLPAKPATDETTLKSDMATGNGVAKPTKVCREGMSEQSGPPAVESAVSQAQGKAEGEKEKVVEGSAAVSVSRPSMRDTTTSASPAQLPVVVASQSVEERERQTEVPPVLSSQTSSDVSLTQSPSPPFYCVP